MITYHGCVTDCRSDFLRGVQSRNSRETDCFVDLFTSYTTVSENLRRILTPDQSGTNPQYNAIVHSDQLSRLLLTPSLHYDSEENLFEDVASEMSTSNRTADLLCRRLADCTRERKNVMDKNLALRDQVRILESRIREADHEVRATRSCLKELEVELRDKEFRIFEMSEIVDGISVKNVQNEAEKNLLKEQLVQLTVERDRLLSISCHPCNHQGISRRQDRCNSTLSNPLLVNSDHNPSSIDHSSPVFTARSVPTPRPHLMYDFKSSTHRQSDSSSPMSMRTYGRSNTSTTIISHRQCDRTSKAEDQSVSPFNPTYQNHLSFLQLLDLYHHPNHAQQQRRAKVISRPHSGSVSTINVGLTTKHHQSNNHPEFLVSGGYDGYVALLDATILSVCYSFRIAPNESGIVTLKLNDDGYTHVIAACLDSTLYVADLERQKTFVSLRGHSCKVTGCGFLQTIPSNSTMTRVVYSCGLDRTIRLWDVAKGNCLSLVSCSSGVSCSTTYGLKVAAGHVNGCVSLWEVIDTDEHTSRGICQQPLTSSLTLQKICTFQPLAPSMRSTNPEAIHEGQVMGLCFSHNGNKLYSVGRDGRIAELSIISRQMTKSFHFPSSFQPPNSGHDSMCLPNDDILIAASSIGLTCWETHTGRCITSWSTPTPPTCVIWTNKLLCSGHTDGTVLLWGI